MMSSTYEGGAPLDISYDGTGRSEGFNREVVRRAGVAFAEMRPALESFARVVTRRLDLKLRITWQASYTDGKTLFVKPPLALGDPAVVHAQQFCNQRTPYGESMCRRCAVNDLVMSRLIHEISHVAHNSFEMAKDADILSAIRRLVASGNLPPESADKLQRALRSDPDWTKIAALLSPYLPALFRIFEDTRIDLAMGKVRPGSARIRRAEIIRHQQYGITVPGKDGEESTTATYDQLPLNSQLTVAAYCATMGALYPGAYNPLVLDAIESPSIQRVLSSVADGRLKTVRDTFNFASEFLEAAQEVGFFPELPEDEDEDQPQPPQQGDNGEPDNSEPQQTPGEVTKLEMQEQESSESPQGGEEQDEGEGGDQGQDESGQDNDGSDPDHGTGESGDSTEGGEQDSSSQDGEPDLSNDGRESPQGGTEEGDDDSSSEAPGDDGGDDEGVEAPEGGSGSAGSGSGGESEGSDDGDDQSAGESEGDGESDFCCSGCIGPDCACCDIERTCEHEVDDSHADDPDNADWEADGAPEGDEGDEALDRQPEQFDPRDYGTPEQVEKDFEGMAHQSHTNDDKFDPEDLKSIEGEVERVDSQLMAFDTVRRGMMGLHVSRPDKHVIDDSGRDVALAWTHAYPKWRMLSGLNRSVLGIDGDFEPSVASVSRVISAVRPIFDANKRSQRLRNLKSGDVAGPMLARRVPFSDPRVFQKKRRPQKRDYAVGIGIDLSASTTGVNLRLLKECALVMADAMDALPGVKFSVWGHSAQWQYKQWRGRGSNRTPRITYDTDLITNIYEAKSWHDPWRGRARQAVTQFGPDSENCDGHTMEYYRKEMARVRATDKVLFYFTDGRMPQANYDEELAILKENLRLCQEQGIEVIGVGINTDSPSEHGLDTVVVEGPQDVHLVSEKLRDRLLS